MNALLAALQTEEPFGALDRPALELARIEYPDLNFEPYILLLDELARLVAGRMGEQSGRAFLSAASLVLFGEFGLTGNESDYYDPRNSFLNDVLIRRKGIPITLSVIYVEIARRLRQPVYGISLPGHFMVRYDDGDQGAFIDPFHGGDLLTREQCVELARGLTSVDVTVDENAFAPASPRAILVRMLNNLRTIYVHREDWPKLLAVLNIVLQAMPDSAEDYKQRGVAWVQMNELQRGMADFQRYLELAPEAEDRDRIVRQMQAIHNVLARRN